MDVTNSKAQQLLLRFQLFWKSAPQNTKIALVTTSIAGLGLFIWMIALLAWGGRAGKPVSDSARNPVVSSSPFPSPSPPSPASQLEYATLRLAGDVTVDDLREAREALESIPKSAAEYKEAARLLAQIKSGKIKPYVETPADKVINDKIDDLVIDNFHKLNKEVTYQKLKKNADRYTGAGWEFTGKILEIQESRGYTVARIGIGGWGLDAVYVEAGLTTDFVEGDRVYVLGLVRGNKTYESQAGWTITIPHVIASAIIKPSEVARFKTRIQKIASD